MNAASWHLLLNHLPIMGMFFGLAILVFGMIFKNQIAKRIALAVFIFSGLSALIANQTGEQAEDVVEKLAGIQEQFIHDHEEAAERFLSICLVLGGVSLVALWMDWKKKTMVQYAYMVVLFISTFNMYFAYSAGHSGGEIRHPEIRIEGAALSPSPSGTQEKDDD